MQKLVTFFECGRYTIRTNKDAGDFLCSNITDITDKIIPFFKKYPIKGTKLKDFLDWVKVAELIKSKHHIKAEGLDLIRKIKVGMNKGRSDE